MNKRKLKIEVKGLSQEKIKIELTPNEYEQMNNFKDNYRISVVTNALNNPKLSIFSFNKELETWQDEFGSKLKINEIKSARCYLE
ncbi:MAG: DUF3883 domain-containing protein [Methanobacteriaceae archaeon]|nr:DUF3883 domain-containing protein [Methanobacteriaceae archaeon]